MLVQIKDINSTNRKFKFDLISSVQIQNFPANLDNTKKNCVDEFSYSTIKSYWEVTLGRNLFSSYPFSLLVASVDLYSAIVVIVKSTEHESIPSSLRTWRMWGRGAQEVASWWFEGAKKQRGWLSVRRTFQDSG